MTLSGTLLEKNIQRKWALKRIQIKKAQSCSALSSPFCIEWHKSEDYKGTFLSFQPLKRETEKMNALTSTEELLDGAGIRFSDKYFHLSS